MLILASFFPATANMGILDDFQGGRYTRVANQMLQALSYCL
jgi:hypothetical protein